MIVNKIIRQSKTAIVKGNNNGSEPGQRTLDRNNAFWRLKSLATNVIYLLVQEHYTKMYGYDGKIL